MSALLERARPLDDLRRAVARASATRPRVVVVRGPRGSGRSALLDEAGDELAVTWDLRSTAPPRAVDPAARAGTRSVAVLLDDADDQSISTLEDLAAQLDTGDVAVAVVAIRSGSDADDGALGRVLRRPGTVEISLSPLTPAAVRAMVEAALGTDDPEVAAEVHRRSGGLPGLVVALLHEPDDPLPVGVCRQVRRALAALPPLQRELVELLAVAPAPITLDVLEAGIARAEALSVRDAGLAVLSGEGLAVHPPVVGDVVLAELPLERRVAHQHRLARSSMVEAHQLTPRERSLLGLLTEGSTNRQMADRLHLSEKTVRNQLSTLFAKLGVERRAQAAVLAVQLGIAPPEP